MREASDVRRVAAIAGVSTIAIVAVLVGKYPFFAATAQKVPPAHATEPQRAQGETVAFVTSPVIDPDPQFFFGAGVTVMAITAPESRRWCATRGCRSSHVVRICV
jgi:hypothetical protein